MSTSVRDVILKKRMKICILQSSYEETTSVFKDVDPYADPARWLKDHECHQVLVKKATAMQQIRDLAKQNFDVFINLCDGAWDEDRAGLGVVQALERFNLPFTGASSNFYEPSKELMKMAAYYAGVNTPAFQFAYNDEDIEIAARHLTFPLIVKHYNGGGSIGMTKDSKCLNADQLRIMARKMINAFGGALIEEFVEGREFTVLVAENPDDPSNPMTYVPVECAFPKGESFKHFDLKWIDYDGMIWEPCKDQKVAEELRDVGRKMFLALKGDSYARCDIRMNQEGKIYFLEINPYCGIFYAPETPGSADCILQHDPVQHTGFLQHIIRCALLRRQKLDHENKCAVRYHHGLGYGLVATRDIKAGEVIEKYEEKAHYLVTKSYVERNWSKAEKDWFEAYAYPLIGDTYVMWSERPTDWRPINHSCDPNTWLVGLDMQARRDIQKNEPITIEYATFCAVNMKPFECKCGTKLCRKIIKPDDCMQSWVEEKYMDHISDYIKIKRAEKKHEIQNHHKDHHDHKVK